MMNFLSIWILGFSLNLFLFYSVFQIYFQTHLVDIPFAHRPDPGAELGIQRIVFIVADGLRADTFYKNPDLHPRLTSLMKNGESFWGISDTRVPTESRPGHVALFAGVYEDPSAIFTGWTENIVEFDSVFNRSKSAVALGSPEIISMFANGAGRERIHGEVFPIHWLNFQKTDFEHLDTWTVDKLQSLAMDNELPHGDSVLIFLHLCGIDTIGHATKPASKHYLENIRHVDKLLVETENLVKSYYNDSGTSFIFTSDHGMTDWGSHGGGSSVETETPFVIWGAGIKGSTTQARLKQPDFAAISAGLLSVPFPTNSIGRFPVELLGNRSKDAYFVLEANFNQIYELMKAKKLTVTSGLIPFVTYSGETTIKEIIAESMFLSEQGSYIDAVKSLNQGIDLALSGIKYYERYGQGLMTIFVTLTFGLWMCILGLSVLSPDAASHVTLKLTSHHLIDLGLSVLVIKGVLGWTLCRIPYILIPFYLGRMTLTLLKFRKQKAFTPDSQHPNNIKSLLGLGIATAFGTELLVLAFYEPRVLTLGLILNSFWVWITYDRKSESMKIKTWEMVLWFGSNAILGFFPMIPAIGKNQSPIFMTLGPLISGLSAIILLYPRLRKYEKETGRKSVYVFQVGILLSVCILIHFPELFLTRFIAWISLILSITIPACISTQIVDLKFLSIFLGISVPFSLLSLNHESLYLPALYFTLFRLLKLETTNEFEAKNNNIETEINSISSENINSNHPHDLFMSFRLAWLELFYTYLSYFGIGNLGTISSFNLSSVRCFVSVLNPFLMMFLLLVKSFGPFLLVSSSFRFLLKRKEEVEQNFIILLFLCQAMALHMFFNVTNEGSWLEIGTSVSHYVIVQVITLFLFLLHMIVSFITKSMSQNCLNSS